MSFRQKILFSQFLLLLALIIVLFPLLGSITNFVLREVYIDQAKTFIASLGEVQSAEEIIQAMIEPMKRAFDMITLIVCIGLLVVNAALIMIVIHRVMLPAQQIINAIGLYKEGKEEFLPHIHLPKKGAADEFAKLASTINSLADQIRKQIDFLTRQKEETEEILESIGEGILATDSSARIIFANTAACQMLGVFQEQVLGRTLEGIEDAPREILQKCHELIVHALQTAEFASHIWTIRDGKTFYHNLISAPLAHRDGALLVIQDKTSDYRIVELGKDFIANASHELKTPITIIRGFAETLQDLPELSREMMMEITGKIVKTCGRLDKLVKSLLTLTDIESLPEKNFVKVDLVSLTENCISTLLAVYPNAKVHFRSVPQSAYFVGDGTLVELAVGNILENAVKYSREPAEIDVFIEQTQGGVSLKIKDQGIGISEEDLIQVFERFYTVDKARSRKTGGAGLGLSIVRTIVEKHKGKVSVSSDLGKGSLFTIFLPSPKHLRGVCSTNLRG